MSRELPNTVLSAPSTHDIIIYLRLPPIILGLIGQAPTQFIPNSDTEIYVMPKSLFLLSGLWYMRSN